MQVYGIPKVDALKITQSEQGIQKTQVDESMFSKAKLKVCVRKIQTFKI